MDRLNDRILALYPAAIPDIDFLLYSPPNEPAGLYNWNEAKLGPQPTAEALAAVTFAASKADLLAYAADKRWQLEIGGITVGGHSIATDRASQAMIAGADALAQSDPEAGVDFKAASGWVTLDADTLHVIALAVGRHVRGLFSRERAICEAIVAGTITTTAEIDAAFAD